VQLHKKGYNAILTEAPMNKYIWLLLVFVLAELYIARMTVCLSAITPQTKTATLVPKGNFDGVDSVDTTTLTGKIMCGYQGWFTCPADGANMGWTHWEKNDVFAPGNCTVDFWPDMTEADADEKFATPFRHPDNSIAYVFSSYKAKTVLRHFKWMQEYGIDGVFVQRFVADTMAGPAHLNRGDTVLLNCRQAANKYTRAYALMYDLSGLGVDKMSEVIDDFKHLVDDFGITKDSYDRAYLHHNGKPVVAVWGIGFRDRLYTLDECMTLVDFLKNDTVYGGCTVMLGLPSGWRMLSDDCLNDPKIHTIALMADIISPWSVGRFGSNNPSELDNYVSSVWVPDKLWCNAHGKDYLPVVFPGFSWHNLQGWGLNHIPRHGGQFLWRQYYKALHYADADMIYQAMFDEIDEGTQIFKCTNAPPVGASHFLKYDEGNGEQPDHYLWLVGEAGKMLRGEIPQTETMPDRLDPAAGPKKN